MSSSIMFPPIIRKGNHSENFLPWFLPICPSPLTPEESHIFKLSEGHQKNPTVYIFPAWLANANISPCRTPREFLYQGWKSQIQTLLPTSAVKEYIENHWEITWKICEKSSSQFCWGTLFMLDTLRETFPLNALVRLSMTWHITQDV